MAVVEATEQLRGLQDNRASKCQNPDEAMVGNVALPK